MSNEINYPAIHHNDLFRKAYENVINEERREEYFEKTEKKLPVTLATDVPGRDDLEELPPLPQKEND